MRRSATMNESALRRGLPEPSLGSGRTSGTPRHPSLIHPILSKRVCFYKSGDAQFNGLRLVVNSRTFKTFDALLDSLSKKVPLPFGVRNITTPRGVHAVRTLDELEDGKSYICSDTRKVKPINLAVARRKPAPWYHARPVSPRRRTAQQARGGRKPEAASARAPRVLTVFRNGDPGAKHSVVLHKRTTPTFESVLEHISELMQFHVGKLHAADGRRVDGFPGLILCSGTVVAAGREPFRPANYNAQISPAQSTLPTNRMGPRRLRALKQRYIVNRIQSSIAGGSCDRPSRSVELESGAHALESVAETPDTGLCVAAGGSDGRRLPSDDDIEKSFRVNQDGSMTVEMRVRLTIKEEETIHWTTTLARSSAASRLDATCSPETGPEQEIESVKSYSLDLGSPASSTDTITKAKTQDDDDEDPPPLGSGVFSESNNEGGGSKVRTSAASPRCPPTPGREHIRKKQASVESVQSVAAQGGTVGSYSHRGRAQSAAAPNVVQQKSGRPVPKPRRQSSAEANNVNGRNVSAFTSAATSEIQRIEPSGGEVSETVSRAFEQQTRQDHFFASLCSQDMSAFGIPFCRPATSETGQLSSSEEFEPPPWRPSTASESIGVWRAEGTSATSALNSPSLGTGAIQAAGAQQQQQQREGSNNKRVSSKPKVINKRVRRLKWPGKKRRENSAPEKNRKVNIFSSAGFIKRIYGNKSKSVKSTMKLKKGPAPNGDRGVTTGSSQQSGDTVKPILKDLNIPLALKETASETVSSEKGRLNVAPAEVSRPGGTPEWQTSTHQQEKKENESCDVSERMSLPAFNSSSAVTIEYVENWLEKACLSPSAHPDEESKMMEALAFVQTENARCVESEKKNVLTTVADDEKCSEDTSGEPNGPPPQDELDASVRQRIRSFESKPSSQSMKKATVKQQIVYSQETATNRGNSHDLACIDTELKEVKPLVCSEIVPPINGTSAEIPPGSGVDNEIQISFKKEAASKARSKELPTPVPDVTDVPDTEHSMMGECSGAPRPGSQTPHTHPLSVSHSSDEAESPGDHTVEMTTSTHPDTSTRSAALLPRTPSIKRAPLVSNKSLDRKMSLRKACLEKYTLCGDASSETSTSSTPINSVGDNVLPSGICPTGTQRASEGRAEETQQPHSISDVKRSLSCCTSASPASLTSEERMSSFSISSSLAPTPTDLSPKGTKTDKTHLFYQKEAMSPKPSVKSVKHMGSPSPGGKSQTKKSPSEPQSSPKLSSLHNRSPDTGLQRLATPNAGNSTERKLNRPKSHKRRSPYSQSLDMGSSPVRHRAGGRRRRKTPRTMNPAAELEKTATCSALTSLDVDPRVESKTADEESVTQTVAQQLDIVKQPNMKPVLEKICYSIKAIRRIAQSKRPSCLEKSNSLPDFSSHVASAFGSSSQSLLAFLSVMTLKAGLDDVNMDKLDANNVSCAEALKMIDSLREIASIDDSHELQASLSSLQRSASKQLLQSWKGFQDLSEKYRTPTPSDSEAGVEVEAVSEKGCRIEENVVDSLDVPERLKEELSCLSKVKVYSEPAERAKTKNNSNAEISKFSTEHSVDVSNDVKADVDVSSIIKKFTDINQPKHSNAGSRTKDARDRDSLCERSVADKCPPAQPTDEHTPEEKQPRSSVFFAKDHERDGVGPNREQARMNGAVTSRIPRAAEDLGRKVLCRQGASVSEAGEQHGSGDEREVECEETQRGNGGGDEDEQAASDYNAEPDVGREVRTSSPHGRTSLSEEEQPEVACQAACTGSNSSVDESTCDPDVDDPSSEEEQPEVEGMRLKVIIEEGVLGKMEQPEVEDKPLNTSSYEDNESSEQERVDIDGHTKNSCTEYQAAPPHLRDTRCEKVVEILKHQTEEITSQSVAERVILLEKQVAQKTTESSALRRSTQRKAPLGPDEEDSPPEPAAPRSAPQSSLSFSYDSSGVVTSEPEGHRVRSIREMFLAKTAADVQHRRPSGSNASEARAETSVSGGYQSQSSSELSSGEDDSARKSITKGFVRRTIERLYGRKDAGPDQEAGGRPPSAPKQKKKEHPSAFSPFHMARCKAMSEFSYFNSTHAVDPLGEATRCVAFNAELRPEDRVSAEGERWVLRENALIRKSVSEPVAINKGFAKSQGGGMREDAEEDPPYSLFSTRSELQDSQSSLSRKCTYFSVPHTSDSDAHLDEPSTVSGSSAEGPSAAGEGAEGGDSGDAPLAAAAEPKRKGNKVHPATEPPPDGEAVLVQPGKGRGVVSTRVEEPDVLDMLYNFCGQNCPIL
ncbi:uncharacterized protein LOC134107515 [Pungitius pungitius]|uniref:uncharacterized protein LOC134107515 n=1 Tax=Pungitius pungitius TaxID=134920 RepID=UPI002E135976